MKQITVYHPTNSHINGGSTLFLGEQVEHSALEDGSLLIRAWRTETQFGQARFAPGQWAYVCESRPVLLSDKTVEAIMTESQIKYMVDRFLGWRLPEPWNPDGGVSYKRPNYAHAPAPHDWPIGTNLFDAVQADVMVRHMIGEMPKEPIGDHGKKTAIQLSPAEIQGGLDRVKWAEGLILQLPDTHEGRNSWLLNFGTGTESEDIRHGRAL